MLNFSSGTYYLFAAAGALLMIVVLLVFRFLAGIPYNYSFLFVIAETVFTVFFLIFIIMYYMQRRRG